MYSEMALQEQLLFVDHHSKDHSRSFTVFDLLHPKTEGMMHDTHLYTIITKCRDAFDALREPSGRTYHIKPAITKQRVIVKKKRRQSNKKD